ncbi:MAG: Pyrroline-5-carboxylate reductase (EC [uncultured Thiotrichaceae bacterium]|uniref:Pyrroline-5-carboxylate reductase n=1 Tax=uncultured Thiotrichaceae bacterium TaxID=298394 RepID=A0A6S6TPV5_9GAMM|nr:MAG: Pyrroline-5-carboxylate reductase (EC [uncultured Thiotrichaceae bacterium]
MKKIITFIGAGNMTRSLVAGLIQDSTDMQIRVSDPDVEQLATIYQYSSNIEGFTDNVLAIEGVDIVVLAVKPQIFQRVCESISNSVQEQKLLIISIAAGVTLASMREWLGDEISTVRCMPNTPALVQAGATGLFASPAVSDEQRSLAEMVMRSVGITIWLEDEAKLDAVTAVSGSGPAYFFLFMEAMQTAAKELGLDEQQARLLVLQTALGSAKLALESDDDVAILRQKVTSKGGTTAAALAVLTEKQLPEMVAQAMSAAKERARELAQG